MHTVTDTSKSGVYQGVLGMVLLVPFWDIFNGQIGLLGIEKASEMQQPSCKSKSFGLVL